jgi:hypothetical protein
LRSHVIIKKARRKSFRAGEIGFQDVNCLSKVSMIEVCKAKCAVAEVGTAE